REVLAEALNAVLRGRTTAEWLAVMEEGGLPAGPVLSIREMQADPQARARGMVTETEHPAAGAVETLGLPVTFHDTPGSVRRPAPRLGEHTAEVLAEAGFAEDEIEAMLSTGAAVARA
ncbi:MAG: CoA transferase, partial [Pseudomonadota bacterium]